MVIKRILIIGYSSVILCLSAVPGHSLEPDEVLVIANADMPDSVDLAKYYMQARHVPDNHLLILRLPARESCSRSDYEEKVVVPVGKFLRDTNPGRRIRCLVLMYGMPLKVSATPASSVEKAQIKDLREKQRPIKKQLEAANAEKKNQIESLRADLRTIEKEISRLKHSSQMSSLDSEIAMVLKEGYPLSGWIPNPYFYGIKNKNSRIEKHAVLMVSRLDGPSPDIVKRIIADSLFAEKNQLSGTAYFDARWSESTKKKPSGYTFYDASIHRAARAVKAAGKTPVVVESTDKLFQPGEGPGAALYCGWYSLARYVDAFTWQRGAIGYHIASSECKTLKKKGSQVWCKRMLEEGVAATIGPVGEPYVQGFPVPEMFFRALVDGYLSLAECYILSLPYLSWRMVLIGDPLYRPFRPD